MKNSAPPVSWQDLEPSIKAVLSSLSSKDLAELEEQITPIAESLKRDKLSTYRPYPKQAEFHAASLSYPERLFKAGNQCLTPDTVIQTEFGERQIVEVLGVPSFGVRSWADGSRCVAQASAVFLKGIEPAFRVHLDNGEVFGCSRKHRVLTYAGWLSLDQLVSLSSGLRWFRNSLDWKASCDAGDRPYDRPLLLAEGIDLDVLLELGDVRERIQPLCNADASGQRFEYNHASQPNGLPSNIVYDPDLIAGLCAQTLARDVSRTARYMTLKAQVARRLPGELSHYPIAAEAFLKLTQQRGLGGLQAFFPLHSPRLTGSQRIVAIEYIGWQPILDMTVESTHCYEAAGVIHHNTGKTTAGAMEAAYHVTGLYPKWWIGHRFDKPTRGWASGVSGVSLRDSVQKLILGDPGAIGTGSVPAGCIIDTQRAMGISDMFDSVTVKHVSGGISRIGFKTYEQGREKWQADTLDWVWFDEEPPLDIYTEGLTRTTATDGIVWLTFTPLKGMSKVVHRFLKEGGPGRHVTTMTIDDVPMPPERKARLLLQYPEHERASRLHGVPQFGSGMVFPVPEDLIREGAVEIPAHWARICGMDIGWDHPTAAAWLAWDRDTDTIHVYDCYRVREQTPVVHAAAIKGRGEWIPVSWPHDGLQHDKGSGEQVAEQYRKQGVAMLPERATFEDGSNGLEAGVIDMLDRMQTGRFKVASHLADWWDEFRNYHRKNGLIVKEQDDIMSATRYAIMMLRHAMVKPKPKSARDPRGSVAQGWLGG